METKSPESVTLIAQLLNKDNFTHFGIQELVSMLKLWGVDPSKALGSELASNGISPTDLAHVKEDRFAGFPFLRLEVTREETKRIAGSSNRMVCIARVGELLCEGSSEATFEAGVAAPGPRLREEAAKEEDFGFVVLAHGRTISKEEQTAKIEALRFCDFHGRCSLESPDRVFILAENFKGGELWHKYLLLDLHAVMKRKTLANKFNLRERIFLGPTSTDAELALLMTNQARVDRGHFVLDPFFGTGSTLVPAAFFGAKCFGFEIDFRVVHGYAVGRVNPQSPFAASIEPGKRVNCFSNYEQYGLERPEVLRCDSATFELGIGKMFDSIVCDPPYGKRASARQSKKGEAKPADLEERKQDLPPKIIGSHITSCEEVTEKLVRLARNALKISGRLVFLYPGGRDADLSDKFGKFDDFELVGVSENPISKEFSRYLVTLERKK